MSDTFTWLSAPGPAALSLLRVSALPPQALDRDPPGPGSARFARLRNAQGVVVDEVVVWHLASGQLELSTHGGAGVRAALARCLRSHGLDEATLDGALATTSGPVEDAWWAALAAAPSPGAVRYLMRFRLQVPPFKTEFLRRAPLVLLTGGVNAGKSTLLNRWCGRQRALVSERPGTTRDLLAAETVAAGWRLTLLDSAGLRVTTDALEREGQGLVAQARRRCDLVVYLRQAHEEPLPAGSAAGAQPGDLVLQAKADLLSADERGRAGLCWSSLGLPGEPAAQLLRGLEAAVLGRLGLPASGDAA